MDQQPGDPPVPPESYKKEDEQDPLGLKETALNFDYLIYKINDHIKGLSDLTYQSVKEKDLLVGEFLSQVTAEYSEIDGMVQKCHQIELEFYKLDQLKQFIDEFKHRISVLETEFK